ncbi:MAG: hypothetical protein E7234_05875 [Lachnospiraceae bacterium]|nr:hypothetical protein [Lachnospiraceae bacterium]
MASKDMIKSGILASLTIAQAILESSWGKSGLTVKGNALFGIKAGSNWKGKVYSGKTQECYNGISFTEITALFRAYNSWEESVSDHSELLTGLARYKNVVGERDYKKACKAIQAAGYATDPNYTNKLISLIETYNLTSYDKTENKSNNKAVGKLTATELIKKLQEVAHNFKTVYMWGVFGSLVTDSVIESKSKQYPSYYTANEKAFLRNLIGKNVFAFDCVNLIKAILWGWNGDTSKNYGGAEYTSNNVPDISADMMIQKCTGVTNDFKNIVPGEAVWLPGHIGIYIGDRKVIECTPAWGKCVQVTVCLNIGPINGLNGRIWQKHGKLPYITYDTKAVPQTMAESKVQGIGAGSKVKVNKGAKTYTGGGLASFVYDRVHIVKEIKNDRTVITYNGVVVAAVKVSDLTLID